ncbi:MAG: hypothetical protein GY756_18595 [bacterium]|nr:hypothetical protein [bacterium]
MKNLIILIIVTFTIVSCNNIKVDKTLSDQTWVSIPCKVNGEATQFYFVYIPLQYTRNHMHSYITYNKTMYLADNNVQNKSLTIYPTNSWDLLIKIRDSRYKKIFKKTTQDKKNIQLGPDKIVFSTKDWNGMIDYISNLNNLKR